MGGDCLNMGSVCSGSRISRCRQRVDNALPRGPLGLLKCINCSVKPGAMSTMISSLGPIS